MRDPFGLIPHRTEIAKFGKLYAIATADLVRILGAIPFGPRVEIATMRAQKAAEKRIDKLTRDMAQLSRSSTSSIYRSAASVTKIQLEILGDKPIDGFDRAVHFGSVKDNSKSLAADFLQANQSMKMTVKQYVAMVRYAADSVVTIQEFQAGWSPSAEEWIDDVARYAIENKLSRRTVTKQILSYLENSLKTGKFIQINGRRYQTRKYAEMVSRTRFRMVQSEAVRNQCAEFGHDLVEISDHGTETEICEHYEGNTYSLTGDVKGYEILDQEPPFHPNCMHNMWPTSEAAIAARTGAGAEV